MALAVVLRDLRDPMATFTQEDYVRWRGSDLGQQVEGLEHALVWSLAGDVRDLDLLDIGCGDGAYAVEAAERRARVWAIDASRERLGSAEARATACGAEVSWTEGWAEALPFPDACFDLVLAVTLLCLVADPQPVLAEIARVLRPGGRLILGELNRWSLWALKRRIKGWLNPRSPWRQVRFRSALEWRRLLEEHGLRVEQALGTVFLPPWKGLADGWFSVNARGRTWTTGAAFLALAARRDPSHVPKEIQRSENS